MMNDMIMNMNDTYDLIHIKNIEKDETRKEEVECYSNVNEINACIYRYKFTEEFTRIMYTFSKIHQYDDRKNFKEAWDIWIEENKEFICQEIQQLTENGYKGDILDKMFKSARYYFRKKSTEKKEPKKRREYFGMSHDLLEKMDEHIHRNLMKENYKPSEGFDAFCKESIELLREEVGRLCDIGLKDPQEIKQKIKKTYKNRYFLIIHKK